MFSILTTATAAFADTGLAGINDAADGIGSYLPFVQGLCYVIAAVIAVVGAMSIYMAMQNSPQFTTKRIVTSVGSCLCFVCMANGLPHFFGLDASGQSVFSFGTTADAGTEGGSSDGFLASDEGGISKSGLIADIPAITDRSGNWIKFPIGTNMIVANHVMDIFDHMGSGVQGSYGRTLDYINLEYSQNIIDKTTYDQLIDIAGSLPHN